MDAESLNNLPKIIGLTGGIGSGKSTVAKFIEEMGFPVYYSDVRAKEIVNDDNRDVIIYERYDDSNSVIVVINNSFNEYNNYEVQIENENTKYFELIYGNMIRTNKNGKMNLNLKPKRGMILKNWKD